MNTQETLKYFLKNAKLEDNKFSLALVVDGISRPEFLLWGDFLTAVLISESSILFNASDLDQSDISLIDKLVPGKQISPISDIESDSPPPNTIFFTNTANFIPLIPNLPLESAKACLLGGLGSTDYENQIFAWKKLNFDFFISDLLPEEIHLKINSKKISNFEKSTRFLPPSNISTTENPNTTNEKILFICDGDLNESSQILKRSFLKIVNEIDHARVVKLSSLPKNDWLKQCRPSEICNVIITDIQSIPLQHYLCEICANLKIRYYSLNSRNLASPTRTFFTGDLSLSEWIKNLSPVSAVSLRQTFQNILDSSLTNPKSQYTQQPKSEEQFIFALQNRSIKETSDDEFKAKLIEIEGFYNEVFSNLKISEKTEHYLNNPFKFILRNEQNGILINAALAFHAKFASNDSSLRCLVQIMECFLRLAANLVHDHGLYHAIYRLLIISPEALATSFQNLYLSAQNNKEYQDLASVVLGMVQNRFIENNVRNLFLKKLQLIKFSPNLSTRNFLACGQLDLFQKALEHGRKDSQKGLAGAAVYQKVLQTQNPDQHELKFLLKLCEDEISINLDDVRTHRSLAFVKILLNIDENVALSLVKISKDRNDFRRFATSWHELALFSLSEGRKKEAHDLLHSPNEVNGGNSAHGRIGSLAVAILLNDYDNVLVFAKEFPQEFLIRLWEPSDFGYTTALYHAIIFKYCGAEKALSKSLMIMSRDRHSQDIRMNKLLVKISPNKEIDLSLKELANALFEGMNFFQS